jgi:F-type H+-transporting ATPase subunit epsilon
MTIETTSGARREFFVCGGFAQMDENVLTVLAEECIPIAALDPEAAWNEIQTATDMPQETDAQVARREEALHAARSKFGLIQKHRKQQGGAQPLEEDMD